ncbi:MAG: hypothetical protein IJY27_04195 [Clostridia bacterium]|nr:hypothetical protein [Clostridia bacterium]
MFTIKIAELKIGIDNKYAAIERQCRDYVIDCDTPDFCVMATDEDIEAESAISPYSKNPAYSESVCIYRHICKRLPEYEAFLLHAAVVECDGAAYAFTARSGTGKSTHVRLWLEKFGDRTRIINGDKPIIRFVNGEARIYGTPWCGKEGYNINTSAPLRALCFIERGETNVIRPFTGKDMIGRLMGQVLIPHDIAGVLRLTALLDRCVRQIPCYLLACNMDISAAQVAYDGMVNGGTTNGRS